MDLPTVEDENELMAKAKALFGDALCNTQGYILSEELEGEEDPMYTIFVGRVEELNLYQIWYNFTNKTQLNVVAAFVPIVSVKPGEPEVVIMLPKSELVTGAAYEVDARNFDTAIWDGKVFRGVRYKMGRYFIDAEQYWNDDDHFGTVKPLRRLE